jgi:hypothetical protein
MFRLLTVALVALTFGVAIATPASATDFSSLRLQLHSQRNLDAALLRAQLNSYNDTAAFIRAQQLRDIRNAQLRAALRQNVRHNGDFFRRASLSRRNLELQLALDRLKFQNSFGRRTSALSIRGRNFDFDFLRFR